MQTFLKKKLLLELMWLIFTALVVIIILLPIYTHTIGYPYYAVNSLYIFLLITLFRYIFFLKFTFLATNKYIKFILFFAFIPFTFYLIGTINGFREYLESMDYINIMNHLDFKTIEWVGNYIRTEMLFTGAGAIILCVAFPFVLLVSIWRQMNKK